MAHYWRAPPASPTRIAVHQAQSSGSNPLIAVRAGNPATKGPDASRCARQDLDEHELGEHGLGELRAHETGTWEDRRARCVAPAKKRCAPVPGKRALQAHDIEPRAV